MFVVLDKNNESYISALFISPIWNIDFPVWLLPINLEFETDILPALASITPPVLFTNTESVILVVPPKMDIVFILLINAELLIFTAEFSFILITPSVWPLLL